MTEGDILLRIPYEMSCFWTVVRISFEMSCLLVLVPITVCFNMVGGWGVCGEEIIPPSFLAC